MHNSRPPLPCHQRALLRVWRTLRCRHVTATISSLTLLASLAMPVSAQIGFQTQATSAYVFDLNTHTVLMDVNSNVPLPPASMSKLMTLNMLFEALEDGRVSLDTPFTVSTRAHAMGGSSMFLETRDQPTAEDLIRGIAIVSGNDATVVVAEGLAGTEDAFARLSTQRAREIGLTNTTLTNASGWPDPHHRMSMRDLATLAVHILEEHSEYYHYFAETDFEWNNISQPNRVPLLGAGIGVDGMKTGHTEEAGFGLVGSVRQGSRRVVFVIAGLPSALERIQEAERIVNWAFRQFAESTVVTAGSQVATADVWMGDTDSVPLVVAEDLVLLVPASGRSAIEARAIFNSPLPAPILAGQEVGVLRISVPEMSDVDVPLLAGAAVAEGGFTTRLFSAASVLLDQFGGDDAAATN
jgi:D-alanyl-D-alanine carboxypeptidase (penicillin-binding protein 5/6)